MSVYLYKVENFKVYDRNLEKNSEHFYFSLLNTQVIHENHDDYKSDNEHKKPKYNHNVIQKAFINVIFAERVHQVAFKRSRDDAEFRTAEEVSSRIFSQLEESLTGEQKKLLFELEAAWSNMYGIFLEYSYCQGIADSPMIHNELEKYGISIVKENAEYNYTSSVCH